MISSKSILKCFFLLLLCSGMTMTVKAQDNADQELPAFRFSDSVMRTDLQTNHGYIRALNRLLSQSQFLSYSAYLDNIAWLYNFVGRYEKAMVLEDKAFPYKKSPETFDVTQYKLVDAVDELIKNAAQYQVTMINEEHRMSRHRSLTYRLLQPLYNLGYRYLAVETLARDDSTLLVSGKPVMASGYYSKDPLFAEMLRNAYRIEYRLIPYEISSSQRPANTGKMNPMQRIVARESAQANNIIEQTLKIDPKAKILVHGGRGHMSKEYGMSYMDGDSTVMGMMAGVFKKNSGIDPFTIDQLRDEEHSDSVYESSVFRIMKNRTDLHLFNMLKKRTGTGYLTQENNFNARIIPSLAHQDAYGRPDWLSSLEGKKEVFVNTEEFQPHDSLYNLVQAIHAGDDPDKAVPADQYAYEAGRKKILLLLEKGKYLFRIYNQQGEIVKHWEAQVQ